MLTEHDLARWRLRSQFLVTPHAPAAVDVVRGLLAVQAENVAQSGWAVAARTATPTPDDLRHLLDEGRVIRTHVLRPTWHYVAAEDIGWLLDLTAPRLRTLVLRQLHRDHGLTTSDLDRMGSVVVDALGREPHRTRDEVAAALRAGGIDTTGAVLMTFLALLEFDQLVCSGRPREGVHTYALFADRVPAAPRLDRAESLAALALRYFTGHGPATEKDLAYWATLPLGEVRTAIAEVRDQLGSFEHQGRTFWHARESECPSGSLKPQGHLLQVLDEMYRGYQDSRMVLDARGVVPAGRETALGMALVDGQLVARMKRTVGQRVVFDLEPYDGALSRAERDALDEAAARYGAFLGLEPVVTVATPG
ncbi:winged helix DNA-binding domain-containing protein [Aeromicrobium phragmitis]|nr:winged helix DNA-binding domain-containing protein [Aeromicrobium phragmitis]